MAPAARMTIMMIPQIPLRLSCFINQMRKAMSGIAKITIKNQLVPVIMPQRSEENLWFANIGKC